MLDKISEPEVLYHIAKTYKISRNIKILKYLKPAVLERIFELRSLAEKNI